MSDPQSQYSSSSTDQATQMHLALLRCLSEKAEDALFLSQYEFPPQPATSEEVTLYIIHRRSLFQIALKKLRQSQRYKELELGEMFALHLEAQERWTALSRIYTRDTLLPPKAEALFAKDSFSNNHSTMLPLPPPTIPFHRFPPILDGAPPPLPQKVVRLPRVDVTGRRIAPLAKDRDLDFNTRYWKNTDLIPESSLDFENAPPAQQTTTNIPGNFDVGGSGTFGNLVRQTKIDDIKERLLGYVQNSQNGNTESTSLTSEIDNIKFYQDSQVTPPGYIQHIPLSLAFYLERPPPQPIRRPLRIPGSHDPMSITSKNIRPDFGPSHGVQEWISRVASDTSSEAIPAVEAVRWSKSANGSNYQQRTLLNSSSDRPTRQTDAMTEQGEGMSERNRNLQSRMKEYPDLCDTRPDALGMGRRAN